MTINKRMRIFASAVASGCFVIATVLAGGGQPVTSEWIFPGLVMLLNGWGMMFNLLTLGSGREAEAFTVNYPNDGDGPDRPMSPRRTTVTLALFWVNGAALLATATQ
ncbi:hypothetical protein U1707_11755 [Sphingomonas sp. PB2P12]|uniref:hypothetical protein n=1 Tax=Sphingomonas sandaracina TaxID=3096157 RepID=UPI002FCACE85